MNERGPIPPELVDFAKAFARANAARDIKRQLDDCRQVNEVPNYTHEIPPP
jgi:hypothetical protein